MIRARVTAAFVCSLLLAGCATPGERAAPAPEALIVDVLAFNIRYGTADDGANSWPHREELVYDVIRRRDADFVGLQEALRFQLDGIREAVPGYGEVGIGRDGAAGEYSAILYKPDRWRVADSGTFWLSDTPTVAGSTSWGNELPRIVTWARFTERASGRGVWVFNTHFDHVSQRSRERSAELLAQRIAARGSDEPVIVTGDFNAGEDNAAIRHLVDADRRSPVALRDTYRVLHPNETDAGTFNGFEGRRDGPKIDYVFAGPRVHVLAAGILHNRRDGRYPSDHFPVGARLALPALP